MHGATGTTNAGTRVAISAFYRGHEEPRAKRIRRGSAAGQGEDMNELVEYGLEDVNNAATTSEHIMRHDDDIARNDDELRANKECEMAEQAGRYFAKVNVRQQSGESPVLWRTNRCGHRCKGERQVRLHLGYDGVLVTTNLPKIA